MQSQIKKQILTTLAVLFLVFCGWIGFEAWSFFKSSLISNGGAPVNFVLEQGFSVKKIANSLKAKKLIRNPFVFVLFARLSGIEHQLKAGEYAIEPGMSAYNLIQKMKKGDVIYHSFTLIEGWNFSQMITALSNNNNVTHTINGLSKEQIMEKIGYAGEIPEGRFAPDTYLFSSKAVDVDVLIVAHKLMDKILQDAWNNRAPDLPYKCSYEVLIVASLIEKETGAAQEKPIIAGIILKRLAKGMALQIDPTVIYGMGKKYSGKIRKADLLKDTPYNTYTRPGLPPTPIAMPGKDSIEAALHPVATKYWYYVSKGDGTHEFSTNIKEQKQAINKYILNK